MKYECNKCAARPTLRIGRNCVKSFASGYKREKILGSRELEKIKILWEKGGNKKESK